MRALRTLADTTSSSSKLSTTQPSSSSSSFSTPPPDIALKSPWHSPVPYLFGGLAAMLGLIAFALLLLACSYWKLSGGSNGEESGGEGKPDRSPVVKAMPGFEEKIVVIMAGDVKPTFLATPVSTRASSFPDGMKKNDENLGRVEMEEGIIEKTKNNEVGNDEHQTRRSPDAATEGQEQNQP